MSDYFVELIRDERRRAWNSGFEDAVFNALLALAYLEPGEDVMRAVTCQLAIKALLEDGHAASWTTGLRAAVLAAYDAGPLPSEGSFGEWMGLPRA